MNNFNGLHNLISNIRHRRRQERHRLRQGRLREEEALEQLPQERLVLRLAQLHDGEGHPRTVGVTRDKLGHTLVVGPTGSGSTWLLTDALRRWPYAALVTDPGGVLHARTGKKREIHRGNVYPFPGYKIDLGGYYKLHDPHDARQLHDYLMLPCDPRDRPRVHKALSLFRAIGAYAAMTRQNSVKVLLDAGDSVMLEVLHGLELVSATRPHLFQFTDGMTSTVAARDAAVIDAFATFTRILQPYQAFYDVLCHVPPAANKLNIPADWVEGNKTIYLTDDEEALRDVGGLPAAIVHGLLRYHMRHGEYRPLLLVLNEALALRLRNLDALLREIGDYGIVLLLYVPSIAALQAIAGEGRLHPFLAHFSHQVWYPPRDPETARVLSAQYGTRLRSPGRQRPSAGADTAGVGAPGAESTEPAMTPVEMMALPQDAIVVFAQAAGQVRFIGQAIPRNPFVEAKPPPLAPRRKFEVRTYTAWGPLEPGRKKLIPGPSPGGTNPALPPAAGQTDSERPEEPAAADKRPNSQKPQQGRLI